MTTKIKAIRLAKNGGPEVMEWVDIPLATPKANEVLVRNKAVGLNFIDIYFRDGLYPGELPHGLGFEGRVWSKPLAPRSLTYRSGIVWLMVKVL